MSSHAPSKKDSWISKLDLQTAWTSLFRAYCDSHIPGSLPGFRSAGPLADHQVVSLCPVGVLSRESALSLTSALVQLYYLLYTLLELGHLPEALSSIVVPCHLHIIPYFTNSVLFLGFV